VTTIFKTWIPLLSIGVTPPNVIVSRENTSQSGSGCPLSSRDEKDSFCEPPGGGRKVALLKPRENDHLGGTRSAGNGPEALMRSADVYGTRNADDMAGFEGTSWEVREVDRRGGAAARARQSVERDNKNTRGVMDIRKCLEYISNTQIIH
jgi:hypothetical protein